MSSSQTATTKGKNASSVGTKAQWDQWSKECFIRTCVEELGGAAYKAGTQLIKVGWWATVIKKFNEQTGCNWCNWWHSHKECHPKPEEIAKWIGRKGYLTQNIMAACDFDMCFTFVESGWEGKAHDTRIFYTVIRDPTNNFPHPSEGEYYLADVRYPNIQYFLAPYKGCTYHIPDWRRGARARNNFEMFNKIHSSLRCTIERTFGVWKARWPMICDMLVGFSMETQNGLVATTMVIHNFIRRRNLPDIPFGFYDMRPEFMPYERGVETTAPNGVHGHTFKNDDGQMDNVRAQIQDHIVNNRIR